MAREQARRWLAESDRVSVVEPRPGIRNGLMGHLRLHDGSFLGPRLVREGLALLDPTRITEAKQEILRLGQRSARERKAGLWGEPKQDSASAKYNFNRIATLCGDTTRAVRQADGSWLLSMGQQHPRRDVGIRIPAALSELFGQPERAYVHKSLCVTGRVERQTLAPEIVVWDPLQIVDRGRGDSY